MNWQRTYCYIEISILFWPQKSYVSFFLWIGRGWSRFICVLNLQNGRTVSRRGDTDGGDGLVSVVCRKGCVPEATKRSDLQISLARTPSYLALGRRARGWPDSINPLPRPIALQEKTTQSREQTKLVVSGQDLFYILDILILKFKSDNGWVCLWL